MRVCKEQERSRRMHWGGVNDRPVMAGEQLHAERGTAMVERCLARSRAMGWQWQSRLLQGVVVVASQGLLPQEGHQVAKLECTKASSKLQHGLPHSNLLATVFHLIHHCSKIGIFHYIYLRICFWIEFPDPLLNAFIVPRNWYTSTWSTGHKLVLKFYALQSWARNLLKEATHHDKLHSQ
jgi:hypothetical protein